MENLPPKKGSVDRRWRFIVVISVGLAFNLYSAYPKSLWRLHNLERSSVASLAYPSDGWTFAKRDEAVTDSSVDTLHDLGSLVIIRNNGIDPGGGSHIDGVIGKVVISKSCFDRDWDCVHASWMSTDNRVTMGKALISPSLRADLQTGRRAPQATQFTFWNPEQFEVVFDDDIDAMKSLAVYKCLMLLAISGAGLLLANWDYDRRKRKAVVSNEEFFKSPS